MRIALRQAGAVVRQAYNDWLQDRAPTLGAALAFYSILSIAPLLVIAVAIAALAFGQEAAHGRLLFELRGLLGEEGAGAVNEMLKHADKPAEGTLATVLGLVTLLFGASGVFGELQSAMNTIWKVPPRPHTGWMALVRQRFQSFAMVLGTGFLLLVSLILSAVIAGVGQIVGNVFPAVEPLLHLGSTLVTLIVASLLFAMIFKLLPDTPVAWRDVWVGALLTAALFTIGKTLIALYLGKSGLASAYGAAGSLVVLIVWTYYSAQILLFGAELTHAMSASSVPSTASAADARPATARALRSAH
jgi:membrane protein